MFVFGSQVLLQKHILTLERGILDRSGPNKSCGPANFRLTSVDHLKRSKRGNFSLGKVCSICFSEICLQNFGHFWGEFRKKKTPKLCLEPPSSEQRPRLASRCGRSETFRTVGNRSPASGTALPLPYPVSRPRGYARCACVERSKHAALRHPCAWFRAPGFLYCRNARAARSFVCNRVRTSPRSVGARRNFFVTSTATATAARFRTAELTFFSCG